LQLPTNRDRLAGIDGGTEEAPWNVQPGQGRPHPTKRAANRAQNVYHCLIAMRRRHSNHVGGGCPRSIPSHVNAKPLKWARQKRKDKRAVSRPTFRRRPRILPVFLERLHRIHCRLTATSCAWSAQLYGQDCRSFETHPAVLAANIGGIHRSERKRPSADPPRLARTPPVYVETNSMPINWASTTRHLAVSNKGGTNK